MLVMSRTGGAITVLAIVVGAFSSGCGGALAAGDGGADANERLLPADAGQDGIARDGSMSCQPNCVTDAAIDMGIPIPAEDGGETQDAGDAGVCEPPNIFGTFPNCVGALP
jgi:hypothetical protein